MLVKCCPKPSTLDISSHEDFLHLSKLEVQTMYSKQGGRKCAVSKE